jgi:hypothetical protein
MSGFSSSSKLPVTNEERSWVDEGSRRLEQLPGRERMLDATIVIPNDYYFRDSYDSSRASAQRLFGRVCGYRGVDRTPIDFEIFDDEIEESFATWFRIGLLPEAVVRASIGRPGRSGNERTR